MPSDNSVVVFIIYDQHCNKVTVLHFLLLLIHLFLSIDQKIFAVHLIPISLKETKHIDLWMRMEATAATCKALEVICLFWATFCGRGHGSSKAGKKDFKMSQWKYSREKQTFDKSSWFTEKLLPLPSPGWEMEQVHPRWRGRKLRVLAGKGTSKAARLSYC